LSEKKDIEKSFPKEDADADETKPASSWAQEPETKRSTPTMGEVFLYIAKQLKEINDKMTALLEKTEKITEPAKEKIPVQLPVMKNVTPPSTPTTTDKKFETIKESLASYIRDDMVEVSSDENNMFYIIRIKRFLGAQNFANIAAIAKSYNGEYVSQGKASHFKIPKGDFK